jgi:NodT family efflux transporter outer membrane factor (OMF) lipoprotein
MRMKRTMRTTRATAHLATVTAIAAALALAGCVVGPDYHGAPQVAPGAEAAGAFHRADGALATAAPPPAAWWEALGDAQLSQLIAQAFAASPTLQQAEARIRSARATLVQRRAAGLPGATATGAAIKARLPAGAASAFGAGSSQASSSQASTSSSSSSSSGTGSQDASQQQQQQAPTGHETIDFYTAGFDAMWEIDLFGGVRRGVEGASAQAEASVAQYEDAQVQLAAEVGQAYASLRGLQRQRALARTGVEVSQRLFELTQLRRRGGTADDLDVQRARTQLGQARAQLPPVEARIEEALDQLALLTAQEPGALDATLGTDAALPTLPAEVPVGDPAALLRRRPDVRAAERALAAGNAAIGQAVAQRFPRVTLFGNIGFSSTDASKLFDKNNLAVVGGPLLRWNFFDFGANRAKVDQARAGYDEAEGRYRQAVLAALQDAETGVSRFRRQRENLVEVMQTRDAAAQAARIAQQRLRGGTISLADSLDVERQRVQAEDAVAQSQTALVTDYVALQKSLGLGWSAPPDLPPDHATHARLADR